MVIRFQILLSMFFVVCQAQGQRLIFENLNVNNGLPASEIYNLLQDHNGYVWAFTEYGIVKHNGSSFVQTCKNLPLKETEAYGVSEGPTGDVFFVNSKFRYYCIRNDHAYKVGGIEQKGDQYEKFGTYIYSLSVDKHNTIHYTSLDYWGEFKEKEYFIKGLPKRKPIPGFIDNVFPVKYSRKGDQGLNANVVKLFPNHLFLKRNNEIRNTGSKYNIHNGRLNLRKFNGKQILSVGSLVLVKERNGAVRRTELPQEVISMEVDSRGFIWVGLRSGGLLELNPNLETVNNYFRTVTISDILFDDQGGMWVSTIGKGLYHCKNVHLRSYKYINELTECISFITAENNELFVGTKEGSLLVKRNAQFLPIHFNMEPYTISDMCYAYNSYFVATHSGYWKVDPAKLASTRVLKPDILTPAYGIRPFTNGQIISTASRCLAVIDIKTGVMNLIMPYFSRTRFIVERNKGEFFTANSFGASRAYDCKMSSPEYLKPLRKYRITRIKVDNSRNLWFCTKENTVFSLNLKNELKRYAQLPDPIINDITFTTNGMVVLSTNKGVYSCTHSEFERNDNWKLILPGEIMQTFEHEKILFIGSKNGLDELDINDLGSRRIYRFFLNEVKAKSRLLPIRRRLELQPEESNIVLSYNLLKYNSNQPVLNYKLKGPIELSGSVTGCNIQFQNLEPGEYQLEVYPEMKFENQEALKDYRTIVVHPAFWETNVFYVIAIFLSGSIIALIFLLFMRTRNKRKATREQMERMLTEYRLTALKAQINPHFMSNSLVAIQNLILQNDTDKANLYIAKFSLLLRSLLDYSNKSAASLKSELALIELYVELEQLRFSNKFKFEIVISPDIDVHDTYIPTLITQPFVENAIWHGLLPLSDHTSAKLTLNVYLKNSTLVISIRDNGVGRAYHKDKRNDRVSKGTELIATRIETLNQLYETTGGKIEITDPKDEDGKSSGTLVTIELPESILNELYENKEA